MNIYTLRCTDKTAMTLVGDPLNQTVPQFCNDFGAREIRIGTKAFECIGETPPQDHPHVYLELGEQSQILCPYCSTLFSFDSSLEKWEAVPPEALFRNTSLLTAAEPPRMPLGFRP
jgi:uncharacterized Zn-finger protein